jgi:serpin B
MVQALRFDTDKIKTHRGFKLLNDKLAIKKPDDKFQLTQANRLFGRQDLNFKDDFLAITKDYYASQLETMDFRAKSESSRKKINAWVEEQTRQRIVDLLPAGVITPETTLVLANALYFKAPWAKSFSEKSTLKDQDFVTEAGTKSASKVSLMKQTDSFMYASNKEMGVTAVELGFSIPYGSDIQATMTFILPNDDKKFAAAEKNLTITNLDTIFKSLAPRKVELSIPKFKVFDSFDNLKDTLSKMGMPTAFEERKANFLGMADISPENIYLGKVIHKTFLETTEAGVEASAATAAIMFGTASARIDNEEPVVFKADHAFMYVLRDRNTGTILFIGKYADVAK